MVKQLIGKVFGFEKEIKGLRDQVKELSWDTSFGMWTRGAFLQFCHVMPRGIRRVAFIDLDNIHGLNEELGYSEVDRRIKAAFSVSFRRSDIMTRWYSGDEIVILFDADRVGADRKMGELAQSARNQGLSFKSAVDEWDVGKVAVEDVVTEMSDRVAKEKAGQETR